MDAVYWFDCDNHRKMMLTSRISNSKAQIWQGKANFAITSPLPHLNRKFETTEDPTDHRTGSTGMEMNLSVSELGIRHSNYKWSIDYFKFKLPITLSFLFIFISLLLIKSETKSQSIRKGNPDRSTAGNKFDQLFTNNHSYPSAKEIMKTNQEVLPSNQLLHWTPQPHPKKAAGGEEPSQKPKWYSN